MFRYLKGTIEAESDDSSKYKINPHIKVCCMTSDFAMQNVLLQMGLNLLAPDGQTIRRVQQWVLRCFACFKYAILHHHLLIKKNTNTFFKIKDNM
jgi:RNA-binding protein NOB1